MRSSALILSNAAVVYASETDDYYTVWISVLVSLFLYSCLVSLLFPYTRPRVPLWAFVLLILFPPGFFVLLIYALFVPVVVATPVVVQMQPTNNRVKHIRSRSDRV